jgi:hypothetical protein
VIKEDLIDILSHIDEDLLLKVDEMVEELVENYETIDLMTEAGVVVNIINEEEFTCYVPMRERKSKSKKESLLRKYKKIEQIKPAAWAWVTIRAKQQGKNPVMAKAGIKAAFARRNS